MNTHIPHSATLLCYDPFISTLLADKRSKVQNGQEGSGMEEGDLQICLESREELVILFYLKRPVQWVPVLFPENKTARA
jgi:hypothetical protein